MDIDPTYGADAANEATRLSRGPAWKANSCSFDCCIFIGAQLCIGRAKKDQVAMDKISADKSYLFTIFVRMLQRN